MASPAENLTSRHRAVVVAGSIAGLLVIAVVAYMFFRQPAADTQANLISGNNIAGVTGGIGVETEGGGLRLCNKTGSRVGIAIGYKENRTWVTEGWWNVSAGACETLVAGALVSRFYYVYAIDYDLGGVWGGRAAMCTRDKMFTIRGIENCVARGYDSAGFFEVDTGEQRSWTVQLTEPGQQEIGIGG